MDDATTVTLFSWKYFANFFNQKLLDYRGYVHRGPMEAGEVQGTEEPWERAPNAASSWWVWVVGLCLLLVSVTTLRHYVEIPRLYRNLVLSFHLGVESNVATWWSGLLLLAAAGLLYELSGARRDGPRVAWALVAALVAALSLDEVGSLHERVSGWHEAAGLPGGWWARLPYALVGATMLAYASVAFTRASDTRRGGLLILGGFVLFAGVAAQEYLEHSMRWQPWMIGLRVGVEEGSELLGMLLILSGVVAHSRDPARRGWSAVVPRAATLPNIGTLLLIGFVLHAILSLWLLPHVGASRKRGDPSDWYPMATCFLAAAGAYWQRAELPEARRWARRCWALLGVLLLAGSLGSNYNLAILVPGIVRWIPPWVLTDPRLTLAYLVVPFLVLYGALRAYVPRDLPWLVALVLVLPGLLQFADGPGIRALVPGGVALALAAIVLRKSDTPVVR